MKLYDVPRNSTIRVLTPGFVPPGAPEIREDDVLNFKHLDGMFSLCYNKAGNPVHLLAWAEVEIINNTKGD